MGMKYFLTHEYNEKWSLVWRYAVLALCIFVGMLASVAMLSSYSDFLVTLGWILLIAILMVEIIYILKITINVVGSKYLDNKKFLTKQLIKKMLALYLFFNLSYFLFMLYAAFCITLVEISYTGFLAIIGFLLFIIGIFFYMTLIIIFVFAIFETLANQEYGFKSVFRAFGQMRSKVFKQVMKMELKLVLFTIIYIVIFVIMYAVLFSISLSLTFSGATVFGLLISMLSIIALLIGFGICQTASIQYLVNFYFTKLAPANNSQNETNEQFVNVNEEQVTINE